MKLILYLNKRLQLAIKKMRPFDLSFCMSKTSKLSLHSYADLKLLGNYSCLGVYN